MKKLNARTLTMLVSMLLFAGQVKAHVVCLAEPHKGVLLRVEINTLGTMGFPSNGEVSINENGNKTTYPISRKDISQFYETLHGKKLDRISVGLGAYIKGDEMVSFYYHGKNFEDEQSHLSNLRDKRRKKNPDNKLSVWKGVPYGGQYEASDFVCGVWMDP